MISHTQRGSTLITSLIILVLLMLLGVTAMFTSDTSFKLAGNLQFENNALNDAESILASVEKSLKDGTILFNHADFSAASSVIAASSGLYPRGSAIDPLNMSWDNANSVVASPGRRIIQQQSTGNTLPGSSILTGGRASSACNKVNTYNITARGTSARGTNKTVQSYYSIISC